MEKNKCKILFVASEVEPFAKTGGLADVAGSLPVELALMGYDVRIAMPRYKKIDVKMKYVCDFPVLIDYRKETCAVRESTIKVSKDVNVPVYFIDNYQYFDRDGIYCYFDEAERFAFFSRAVLEALPHLDFKPDIIHCNDWQTGPIPMMIKEQYKTDFYKDIATLYTVHNIQYQGNYPKESLKVLNLDETYFTPEKVEFFGQVGFMKMGLLYSDIINTVSETYAKEIQTEQYGEKLEGLLKGRKSDLYGIVNGIGEGFDPKTDKNIYKNYGETSYKDKYENKRKLQKELGLPQKDVPVVSLVTRLVDQKGLDLIAQIADQMLNEDIQLVVLGLGDRYYENLFDNLKQRYLEKVSSNITFDAKLAQKIYAGSDIFLMPSKFEPCGLGQLISLKYGTIPIVRLTGGLADTVQDYNSKTGKGNGFAFSEYNSTELFETFKRAIETYTDKKTWESLVVRALSDDYSWTKSAKEYEKVYKKAIDKKKKK